MELPLSLVVEVVVPAGRDNFSPLLLWEIEDIRYDFMSLIFPSPFFFFLYVKSDKVRGSQKSGLYAANLE